LLAEFFAFLIVKGGKFLFLANIALAPTIFINPFAATFTFAGVISGLFTEKGYQILSGVTDQIGNNILG